MNIQEHINVYNLACIYVQIVCVSVSMNWQMDWSVD